jgi:hypothetical protein
MGNIANNKSEKKPSRHVLAVQKAQLALAKSKADEQRRHAEERETIKEAERNAAEMLSRAKYLERRKFKDREYKFATPLGLMLLEALRTKGLQGILLSAQDIESKWSTEACLDLLDFLKSSPTDFLDTISAEAENKFTQSEFNESEISVPPQAFESSAF